MSVVVASSAEVEVIDDQYLAELADTVRAEYQRSRDALGQCVAAAAVEIINAGRGGNKLAPWWKAEAS